MRKTLNVLYLAAIAVIVQVNCFAQQPLPKVERGSSIAGSFRSNAIRKPDSIARIGMNWSAGDVDCGLHRNAQTNRLYTSFMDGYVQDDLDLARALGSMRVGLNNDEFIFGPQKKADSNDLRGTECRFNLYDSTTTVTGKFNFLPNFPEKTIEMEFAGAWRETHRKGRARTDLVGRFDLGCIPKKAWEKLADKARITTALNENVDWQDQTFLEGLAEFLDPNDKKTAKNLATLRKELVEADVYYRIEAPAKIPSSLLLSSIEFYYDEELNSLWYSGEVGLLAINGISVNKLTNNNSKLEYVMAPRRPDGIAVSDTLRMYLEFDELNWVFFECFDDVVRTISSDIDGFNAVLEASNPKKKGFRFKKIEKYEMLEMQNSFVNRYIFRLGRLPGK
jgi:hypothetical protein